MITENDICYVAGPMSNYEDWNHAAFVKAGDFLHDDYGCAIHNPAKSFKSRKDLERKTYMRHCIHMLMEATCVYFLKGWTESKGAQLEYSIAKELGLRLYYQ